MNPFQLLLVILLLGATSGCAFWNKQAEGSKSPAEFVVANAVDDELQQLPSPRGPITVAVYGFRDQSGQYKQSPDSSFSTAVSQGGAAMLVKALSDSGWFTPVEREGLQNLLSERKIIRANESSGNGTPAGANAAKAPELPNLLPANLIIEGAVVGYDFNVSSGGIGVKYLGISASQQFRKDQVTVNLRAIDTNTGKVLHSISTTKTIYSSLIQPGIYRFVSYKELFEAEAGYTSNEPVQMAVKEAIDTAVLGLIVEGIFKRSWLLANPADRDSPLIQRVHAQLNNQSRVASADANQRLSPRDEAFVDDGLSAPVAPPRDRYDAPRRAPAARADSPDAAIRSVVEARRNQPASPAGDDSFVDSGRE